MADVHPQVQQLYQRIYERSDIRSARGAVRVALVIAGVWLLCGVINYLFLASSVRDEQERAIVSFAFGPAFVPLDVARAGDWVTIADVDVPLNVAALIIGGLPTLLCGGLLFANGGSAHSGTSSGGAHGSMPPSRTDLIRSRSCRPSGSWGQGWPSRS